MLDDRDAGMVAVVAKKDAEVATRLDTRSVR